MRTYAIMKNPGYTRVSFQESTRLAILEATALGLGEDIKYQEICGIPYILLNREAPHDLFFDLSFAYAVFELDGEKLIPLPRPHDYFIQPELSSLLKYQGKTNEFFTRFMLNLSSNYTKSESSLHILDPMAGKGTTLYEALIKGHHAYGVEMDQKLVQESNTYMKKYLETSKIKHQTHTERISATTDTGRFTATRHQIKIAGTHQFEMLDADTRHISHLFKKNFFDLIVADLPYGVQHGSKTGAKKPKGNITRNPLSLIEESLPGWTKVLKPGGVITLAWNAFLLKKEDLADLLEDHDFTLPDFDLDFKHRVDQAIDRDLIIGILQK